jgi:hypothetical protein
MKHYIKTVIHDGIVEFYYSTDQQNWTGIASRTFDPSRRNTIELALTTGIKLLPDPNGYGY